MRRLGAIAMLLVLAGCGSYGPATGAKAQLLMFGTSKWHDGQIVRNGGTPQEVSWGLLALARNDPSKFDYIRDRLLVSPPEAPLVRATAAEALRMMGDARALPTLRESCRDKSSVVRADAVEAVGMLGGDADVPLLAEAMYTDLDDRVRLAAVHAIARIATPAALKVLVENVTAPDEAVAFEAHRALVRISRLDMPPRRDLWQIWLKTKYPDQPEPAPSDTSVPPAGD